MRTLRKLLLLAAVFAWPITALAQQKAPGFSLKDIRGRSIKLSDFKGQVVLLNFWATWCVPCRTEIPDLVKKQRDYRRRGLRVLGITYPPARISEVRSFARKLRMNYPILIGSKETKQAFTSSETLPFTIVVDRDGNIRATIEGIMYSDEFDEKVKPLLSTPASRSSTAQRSAYSNIRRPPTRLKLQASGLAVSSQVHEFLDSFANRTGK